ncbi:hypothetical protein HL653_20965 [Sphingomonas sp. AP4-R1]|uniref:hypothetical protein n=1 Tax=Sphingomonas sp. AP4-R1 TaxID=2735134 RepID=UPI00149349DC|nr:hypothetical protein [Sphingomonas sp. AP4-R1]QJU59884.1 hypothetical protein HL653_20965 [Sphingomonas sp. AP4-R1]
MMIAVLIAAVAGAGEPVICLLDERPIARCRMEDRIFPDGRHRLTFSGRGARVVFEGKGANGWWSGTLDGRPAMGRERNRGYTDFSTRDLQRRFSWWYPADEHGTY